jgi:hypothetical protein
MCLSLEPVGIIRCTLQLYWLDLLLAGLFRGS